MVYQPPSGARDLLPLDVAQKRWIEDRLQQVLHSWGYHRIITSTLERLETLMAGGAIAPRQILQLQTGDDQALGLRPELTASIARTAITRMASSPSPQRLYYNANVFRRPEEGSHNGQQEQFQTGVELLGAGGLLADAEIVLLLINCLQMVGLGDRWQLILGEAGLTRSLLSVFPEAVRSKVRHALAHLDRLSLEQLELPANLLEQALFLLELRGRPADVLQQVSQLPLDEPQRQRVNHLKSLIELLQTSLGSAQELPIVLDLSLIRTFDYYTGIVFEVVSDPLAGQQILGQGGRYDELLGVYHPQGQSQPGIGFCFEIERLHQALLPTGQLPQTTPACDWLVVATQAGSEAIALTHAQSLRQTHRVELALELANQPEEMRTYARDRGIAKIAWVSGAAIEVETLVT
ncbi:MAG: ATP phosphoribosyltransferase regulatory subunit [Synechococcales bacterium]|nr:ATP phosphoribosyltransferase regulatory subunit [Synechococcales bacterium]